MSAVSVSDSGMRTILAEAADLARRALVDLEPAGVGEYLGVRAEDDCAATHRFEATLPGYRGWQWAVVVAAAPDSDRVTVSESALLPGPDALVAPEFVPWEQRIRPGDLGPGDLLAPPPDDPRLAPGYTATGDPEIDELAREVGLGRKQVLSREGRLEAAERWYLERGPGTEMAKAAPGTCMTCGFYLPLAGALHAAFGVCANMMGADGQVVHVEYGCGAHSDTPAPQGAGSPLYEAYDDAAIEVVPTEALKPAEPEQHAAGNGQPPAESDQEKATGHEPAATAEVARPSDEAPERALPTESLDEPSATAADKTRIDTAREDAADTAQEGAADTTSAATESVPPEPDSSSTADTVAQVTEAAESAGAPAEAAVTPVHEGTSAVAAESAPLDSEADAPLEVHGPQGDIAPGETSSPETAPVVDTSAEHSDLPSA